ncbi:sortase [Agreia sp. COWG]|uniref:sortase n=1 Tax=Agreia sp. COWG TaxID=2773266 RepID=UPI001928589C|nr:sortase [Agreia sp. COWG]
MSLLLAMVSVVIIFLLANLVVVSQVQHYAGQANLFSELRLSLAEGSAPVQPTGVDGQIVSPGTPVAVMFAPVVGVSREVIVEGTSSGQTMIGAGHRRDTVLPCQVGASVVMARSGGYGGVGSAWAKLTPGDEFTVTTGQGSCTYTVRGQRMAGDDAPAAPTGRQGRITLTTAYGVPFMPTEVLRIDADLTSDAFDRPVTAFPPGSLPESEAAMGVDTSNLFALVLLLELLIAVAIGATYLWRRWGKWHTWIVVAPVAVTTGLLTATSINYLLPNLL